MEFIIRIGWIILVVMVFVPILVYFCIKFGTVAYYKGKEVIKNKQNKNIVDIDNEDT